MCGIFGFLARKAPMSGELNAELLRSATHSLSHRGPDAQGIVGWTDEGLFLGNDQLFSQRLRLGLGHCRLKIFDLSDAGNQPMKDAYGNWLVFNGEIYNFKDLRKELSSLGYRFVTETDTEVILAAYAHWGKDCVRKFNGMWAFVLYDSSKRCLFISRDRLGIKPLYYVFHQENFLFSSEVGAFFQCPGLKPYIIREKLASYIIDHKIDNEPDTIYKDIKELRGGHCMQVNLDSCYCHIWSYWELPEETDLELSDDAALERFSELVEDSVRLRLQADVPVAITLSGGIDSTVISVAASRLQGTTAHTFTSRFPNDPAIDESTYAMQVVESLGFNHSFVEPAIDRLIEEEPILTQHQAMPFGTLSIYVHWAILSRIGSLGFPVVLSGQGGDELFLGYERYHASVALSQWPNLLNLLKTTIQASRHSQLSIAQTMAQLAYFSLPALRRYIKFQKIKKIYNPDLLTKMHTPEFEVFSDLRQLQSSELREKVMCRYLRFDDRNAGALGMETRIPFLDYRLVEFAYRLPLRHKIRNGWTKYLLRRYISTHVPKTVTWRKHKFGFNSPQSKWTDSLVSVRGKHLQKIPFAKDLLSEGVQFQNVPTFMHWDVYNILHLAHILRWEFAD